MARNRRLRPIDETRRPDGTLTSETAYRLLKRRGGLARAAQMRPEGFITLKQARENSIVVRTLKAKRRSKCDPCKAVEPESIGPAPHLLATRRLA